MIGHIDGSVDSIEEDEVSFNPFTQGEVFYVNMSGSRCWFLCVAHGGTAIIVFIEKGSGFLWNVEIPKDTPDEKDHLTSVIGSHKFRFSGGSGDRWLEFALIRYRTTSKVEADSAE